MKSIDNLEKVQVNEEEINEFMPEVYRKLDWLNKEDVLKRVVSIAFNRFLDYYRNRPEIEIDNGRERKKEREGKEGKRSRNRIAEEGFSRLFINLGRTDRLNPKALMSLVNEHIHGKVEIGRIDVMQNYSFFEVREEDADRVVRFLNGQNYKNRSIIVEFSNPGEGEERSQKTDRRGRERKTEKSARENKKSAKEKDREVVKQLQEIKAAKKVAKNKPSREERGYTKPRGRKDDWMQFFMQDSNLKGETPDFNEDGWVKKSKKKK